MTETRATGKIIEMRSHPDRVWAGWQTAVLLKMANATIRSPTVGSRAWVATTGAPRAAAASVRVARCFTFKDPAVQGDLRECWPFGCGRDLEAEAATWSDA